MIWHSYQCKKCDNVEILNSKEIPDKVICSKCGSETFKLFCCNFITKGSGWYKDGYSK